MEHSNNHETEAIKASHAQDCSLNLTKQNQNSEEKPHLKNKNSLGSAGANLKRCEGKDIWAVNSGHNYVEQSSHSLRGDK